MWPYEVPRVLAAAHVLAHHEVVECERLARLQHLRRREGAGPSWGGPKAGRWTCACMRTLSFSAAMCSAEKV